MSKILASLSGLLTRLLPTPVLALAKAIAAAVLPLVTVSLLNGAFDYKAIVAAALTAIVVYLVPNKTGATAQADPQPVSAPVVTPPSK